MNRPVSMWLLTSSLLTACGTPPELATTREALGSSAQPDRLFKPGRDFALNLHNNLHREGAVVNLWRRNGHESQTWTFDVAEQLHPSADSSLCLTHGGDQDNPANGASIYLSGCSSARSQRWTLQSDGTLRKSTSPGKCLNLHNNVYADGAELNVWDCNGHESQVWARPIPEVAALTKPGRSFALNLEGDVRADGTVVNLWSRTGHQSQTWMLDVDGRIHPGGDGRFCLAHRGDADNPGNGAATVLWSCVDHNSQRWVRYSDGTIRKRTNPAKCLNLHNNVYADGAELNVWDCNGHESQEWQMVNAVAALVRKPGRDFTLNLHGNGHSDGTIINLWSLNGHESQAFSFGLDGRIHPAGDERFCLAHTGDAVTPGNGEGTLLWSCVDHDSQRWTRFSDGTIRKRANLAKCLNLHGNVYADGAALNVWDCNGHESQTWEWQP